MGDWHDFAQSILEDILLVGAGIMAIWYGLRRIYNTARSVEKILEFTQQEKERREEVARELQEHMKKEEDRAHLADSRFSELASDLREITREIRPNGGTSMKDVINQTNERVHELHTRLSILETKEGMK
jgi:biopolymer transport protein ExbB/TolQ